MGGLSRAKELVTKMGRNKEDKKDGKDKRNMHLAKEGVIHRESKSAEGVSDSDLAKRDQAEIEKKKKLKDSNFFVSPTRLSVRNLPATFDDTKLKELFLTAAGPGAKVLSARLVLEAEKGVEKGAKKAAGRSKGYGFIEFSEHKHAMRALRGTNNNPEVSGKEKRPIVEFSIENVHKVKQLREKQQRRAAERLERSTQQGNVKLLETNPSKRKRKDRGDRNNDEEESTNSTNTEAKGKGGGKGKSKGEGKGEGGKGDGKGKSKGGKGDGKGKGKGKSDGKGKGGDGPRAAQAKQDQRMDALAEPMGDKNKIARGVNKRAKKATDKKVERDLDSLLEKRRLN